GHVPGGVPMEHVERVLRARFLGEREVKKHRRGRQVAKRRLGELAPERRRDAARVTNNVGAGGPIADAYGSGVGDGVLRLARAGFAAGGGGGGGVRGGECG